MTRYPFYTKNGAGPLFYMATNGQRMIAVAIPQRYISASNVVTDTGEPDFPYVTFRWRGTRPFEEFAYEAERDLTPAEIDSLYRST